MQKLERAAAAMNGLLARLGRDEEQGWVRHLERVCLSKGTTVYEIGDAVGHAYFPLSGLVSLMSMTEEGETIEVALEILERRALRRHHLSRGARTSALLRPAAGRAAVAERLVERVGE